MQDSCALTLNIVTVYALVWCTRQPMYMQSCETQDTQHLCSHVMLKGATVDAIV